MKAEYLNRKQALDILRVKASTLYCYVSRGYIRSVPQGDGRSSFYIREDVEKVKAKSLARSGHGPAAASAMRWGEPVILTSVTEITELGPRYRTRYAVDLARANAAFEAVAEYLWTGAWHEASNGWDVEDPPQELPRLLNAFAGLNREVHILQMLGVTAATLGIAEGPQSERIRSGGTPVLSACRLMRCMAGAFGFLGPKRAYRPLERGEPIAQGVGRVVGLAPSLQRTRAINMALVLLADNELNPATFAARIAASSGTDLHSCIGAAIDVQYGTLAARECDRVQQLFSAGASPASMCAKVRALLDAGQALPGFNHPLYPRGDPRASLLIEAARAMAGSSSAARQMLDALRLMEERFEVRPSIMTGLVAICRALGAPEQTAAGLFALGRCAGWVAHILEQRLQGFLIRPRAKFIGAPSAQR